MNNFWTLVGFEYDKLLNKKAVIIALLCAFIIILFSCFATVIDSNSQSDFSGNTELSNYESMLLDKSYALDLAGRELNTELIMEASNAYKHVDIAAKNYAKTEGFNNYARPYMQVYSLIDSAYVRPGYALNIEEFQKMPVEEAENYYTYRINQYESNLTYNPYWSAADVEQVIAMDKKVKKPFIMQYVGGYKRIFGLSSITMLILLFLISFIISPIYSGEYSRRTDSLLLTTKNGKKSMVYAKIFASISISFCITLAFFLTTYFACMGIYGFEGTNAQIQLLIPLITYDFTLIEATLLLLFTSLLGAVMHTAICMLISTISRRTIIPMSLSSTLIIVAMFSGIKNPFFYKLRYFLPTAMGSFNDVFTQRIIHFFGLNLPLYQAISMVAIVLSIIMFFVSIQAFKKRQVC